MGFRAKSTFHIFFLKTFNVKIMYTNLGWVGWGVCVCVCGGGGGGGYCTVDHGSCTEYVLLFKLEHFSFKDHF